MQSCLARATPLYYYQEGRAAQGLEWRWFLGFLIAAMLSALLAWLFFLRRDIRVGGERSRCRFRVLRVRPVVQTAL